MINIKKKLLEASHFHIGVCNRLDEVSLIPKNKVPPTGSYVTYLGKGKEPDLLSEIYFSPMAYLIINTSLKESVTEKIEEMYSTLFYGQSNDRSFAKKTKNHDHDLFVKSFLELDEGYENFKTMAEHSRHLMLLIRAASFYPHITEDEYFQELCFSIQENFNEEKTGNLEKQNSKIDQLFISFNLDRNKILKGINAKPTSFDYSAKKFYPGWLVLW